MDRRHLLFGFFALLLAITRVYGLWMEDGVQFIRVIGWGDFAWLVVGWALSGYQSKAGLPPLLGSVSASKSLWLPVLVGLGFAFLDVWMIEGILRTEVHQSLPPYTQPFPYALFLYGSAAVHMELVYKLIPFTIGMFLVTRFASRPKIWAYALMVLLAVWEPLEQMPSSPGWFVGYSLASGFAFNFVQLFFYHRFGWVYSFLCRVGLYLLWHVLLGVWIEYGLTGGLGF